MSVLRAITAMYYAWFVQYTADLRYRYAAAAVWYMHAIYSVWYITDLRAQPQWACDQDASLEDILVCSFYVEDHKDF